LCLRCCCFIFFFFNDTATTEIYTLSLHDALPIFDRREPFGTTTATRFATVNDLMRSPHLVPLGHVIGWADEPLPA